MDIIYANVKHAVFQPCVREHVVLVHFHLKKPIIVGKKKSKDVQFYTEAVESSQVLTHAEHTYIDASIVVWFRLPLSTVHVRHR